MSEEIPNHCPNSQRSHRVSSAVRAQRRATPYDPAAHRSETPIQPPQTAKTSCDPDVMHYTDAAEDKPAPIETP